MADPEIKKEGKKAVSYATGLLKKGIVSKAASGQEQEMEILLAMKGYLESEFNASIVIDIAEKSSSPKAKFAEPGRPGIQIES